MMLTPLIRSLTYVKDRIINLMVSTPSLRLEEVIDHIDKAIRLLKEEGK